MVEAIPTEEQLDMLQRAADLQERLNSLHEFGANAIANYSDFTNQATTAMRGLSSASIQATDVVSKLTREMGQFTVINSLIERATDSLNDLGSAGVFAFAGMLGAIPQATDLFGRLGASGAQAGTMISDSLARIKPTMDSIPVLSNLTPAILRAGQFASQAQAMELSLIGAAAASGQLDEFVANLEGGIDDLGNTTESYNEKVFQSAVATGQLPSKIQDLAFNLLQIPGSMQATTDATDMAGQQMNMLQATLTLASAFGLENKDVMDQLRFAYEQFGTTGEDALDFVARMNSASQDLTIPIDTMTKFVRESSSAMKIFGDNTEASIAIMTKFGGALKDSGLGPAGIAEIVGAMTQGIARMDVAQKAFISGATGGPGGLAGAFELDKLIREGRMDEVLERTMTAMQRQFGGEIVTLDDVTKTPALAGEFLKQMSFLKDVAGIAGDDQQAQRILEAMKAGEGISVEDIRATQQQDLQTAVDRGSEIQDRNMNKLLMISQEMERAQQITAAATAEQLRFWLGTTGERAEGIRERTETATLKAEELVGFAGVTPEGARGTEVVTAEERRTELVEDGQRVLESAFEDIKNVFSGQFENLMGVRERLEGENRSVLERIADGLGITAAFTPEGETKEGLLDRIVGAMQSGFESLAGPAGERVEGFSLLKALGLEQETVAPAVPKPPEAAPVAVPPVVTTAPAGGVKLPANIDEMLERAGLAAKTERLKITPAERGTRETPETAFGEALAATSEARKEVAAQQPGQAMAVPMGDGTLKVEVVLKTDELKELMNKQFDMKWKDLIESSGTGIMRGNK